MPPKASEMLLFWGKNDAKHANPIHIFLEHNVYLEKTHLFLLLLLYCWDIGTEVWLTLDYFCALVFKTLGLCLANSFSFLPDFFFPPQLEFLIEENKWCLKLPIRNFILRLSTGSRPYFCLSTLFFLSVGKLALNLRWELAVGVFHWILLFEQMHKKMYLWERHLLQQVKCCLGHLHLLCRGCAWDAPLLLISGS